MSGNAGNLGAGGVDGNPKPEPDIVMACYDELPAGLRARVQEAVFDWDVTALLANYRRGVSEREILRAIDSFEEKHAKRV